MHASPKTASNAVTRATTSGAAVRVKNVSRQVRQATTRLSREEQLAAALSPQLGGIRAAEWIRRWDKGTRSTRLLLLEAFLVLHEDSNSTTMERDLGDAAPLLFTRITAWLHLTYKSFMNKSTPAAAAATVSASSTSHASADNDAHHTRERTRAPGEPATRAPPRTASTSPGTTALLLLVKSITVFVRGASYMTQLVESGAAAVLTDSLACGSAPVPLEVVLQAPLEPTNDGGFEPIPEAVFDAARAAHPYALLSVEERTSTVVLLLFMANAGRVYREMICDEDGSLLQLLHAMQREREASVAELLMELFSTLSQGNPRMAPLLQTALVRILLCHQYMDVGNASDMQLKHARAFLSHLDTSRLEVTQSADVAMQAARALHTIQRQKESHYLASTPGQEAADRMPVAGLCSQQFAPLFAVSESSEEVDPLLVDVKANEYLSALFYLILHDTNTRFRVEGSELLALACKNTELTRPALDQCFDALDDDLLVVADDDNVAAMRRRQRRQLSCGRAAVQTVLSRPMTQSRHALIVNVISLRSAHMTLLKYLRMTESGDTASVVDACRAIQLLVRASDAQQREALLHHVTGDDVIATPTAQVPGHGMTPVARVGIAIREAVGDSLYQVLLHQDITEEEAFAILRAARSTATGFAGRM